LIEHLHGKYAVFVYLAAKLSVTASTLRLVISLGALQVEAFIPVRVERPLDHRGGFGLLAVHRGDGEGIRESWTSVVNIARSQLRLGRRRTENIPFVKPIGGDDYQVSAEELSMIYEKGGRTCYSQVVLVAIGQSTSAIGDSKITSREAQEHKEHKSQPVHPPSSSSARKYQPWQPRISAGRHLVAGLPATMARLDVVLVSAGEEGKTESRKRVGFGVLWYNFNLPYEDRIFESDQPRRGVMGNSTPADVMFRKGFCGSANVVEAGVRGMEKRRLRRLCRESVAPRRERANTQSLRCCSWP